MEATGAVDWLDKNSEKTTEELVAAKAGKGKNTADDGEPQLEPGETAQSLICKDCGRKLRSTAQAEWHATKSGHTNFEESTEEIAPLTEEEKKARLEELRAKMAAKRAGVSEQDKIDKKRNEEIRRKTTKETQDIKEDLAKKELLKDAAAKKREKQEDALAKQRIKDKIAADKEERRLKAEKEKAARAGQAPPLEPATTALSQPAVASTSKPASAYTESRLRLQTPSGTITKAFSVDTTLFEVASHVTQESDDGFEPSAFVQNFPRKTFDSVDFGATLKEMGLVPSASLIVK